MASKLINNTLSSLSSGVSEQYDAGRFDSQVNKMINCLPNITRGVLRRNPLHYVTDISTADLTNAFVYSYDRGTGDEQYLATILGDGSIRVYNVNTGALLYTKTDDDYLKAPVGTRAKDIFKALTIGDHTFIVNTSIVTNFTSDLSISKGYSDMAFYWIKKTTSVVTDQYQTGTGTSGEAISSGSKAKGYDYTLNNLQVNAGSDTRPNVTRVELNRSTLIAQAFVGDVPTTPSVPIMTSNTVPAGQVIASASQYPGKEYLAFSPEVYTAVGTGWYTAYTSSWESISSQGYIGYKGTADKIIQSVSITPKSSTIGLWLNFTKSVQGPTSFDLEGSADGITWTLIKSFRDIRWTYGQTRVFSVANSTAYLYHRINILATVDNKNAAIDTLQFSELDANYTGSSQATHITTDSDGQPNSSICYTLTEPTKWDWSDTFGNEASRGVWQTVPDSDELPAELPEQLDTFKVKVNGNTTSELDDYFLEYNHSTKGWKETMSGGISYKLDGSTMPHTLYRLADGSFIFDEYKIVNDDGLSLADSAWAERTVGGADLSTEDPSFIGSSLNGIFFYKNRLGLITDSNIVLSRTGDYNNYFLKTLQDQLDDDPIDLAIASTDVSILSHAEVLGGNLVILSDATQFTLDSSDDTLTPKTANITALSNYTYNKLAPAKAIGNKIFFTNVVGNYSQVFTYQVSDSGIQITDAIPRTLHIPSYISNSVYTIKGHDVLGQVFFANDANPKELVVLSTATKGKEELQNAFHKWEFAKNIVGISILNNDLYILFSDGILTRMSLEIPGNIEDVEYKDDYNDANLYEYISYIRFSQFYYRTQDGKGTERGRYQLRTLLHDITDNSYYRTRITNTNLNALIDPTIFYGPTWIDTDLWDDTLRWQDVQPKYERVYENDSKITIMGDSQNIEIDFASSITNPYKGFEIATTNIEALFHQRSTRT